MTREEAIQVLKEISTTLKSWSGFTEYPKAIDMAIEALEEGNLYIKVYADDEPSVKAEKLYQICGETQNKEVAEWLKEYFPSVDVVRCKDCCHRVHDEERGLYYCKMYYGQGDVSDENFCQWGERKAR